MTQRISNAFQRILLWSLCFDVDLRSNAKTLSLQKIGMMCFKINAKSWIINQILHSIQDRGLWMTFEGKVPLRGRLCGYPQLPGPTFPTSVCLY